MNKITYTNVDEAEAIVVDLLSELSEHNPNDENNGCTHSKKLRECIQEKYGCDISISSEKINSLQYNHFYEISFNGIDDIFYVEIENGINNGTRINHAEWEYSSKPKSRTVEVIKEIIFDNDSFVEWYNKNYKDNSKLGFNRQKAKTLFEKHKNDIRCLYSNLNYDNYVTGGCSYSSYYNDKFTELRNKGVFWKCEFDEIEADVKWC